jgi:UDP-N-acetylglucosamine 2-epimerase (non-hydrolysing)
MKILTLVGTRPELIRLSLIIKKLDKLVDHVFVYTNQNYDYNLSGVFFEELQIRDPDYSFNSITGNTFGTFLAGALPAFENVLLKEWPDKILILGDTNSGLLALAAKKFDIPLTPHS